MYQRLQKQWKLVWEGGGGGGKEGGEGGEGGRGVTQDEEWKLGGTWWNIE